MRLCRAMGQVRMRLCRAMGKKQVNMLSLVSGLVRTKKVASTCVSVSLRGCVCVCCVRMCVCGCPHVCVCVSLYVGVLACAGVVDIRSSCVYCCSCLR